MARPLARMRKLVGSTQIVRHVGVLVSGTAIAQVLTMVSMVILARLYTPHDFGLFVIVQSIVGIGTTVASLRYDLAILLPKSAEDARVVHRLASRSILTVSCLLAVVLFALRDWISDEFGDPELGYWAVASSLIVFLTSQVANQQYWLTRMSRFRDVAVNRVLTALAVGVSQIVSAVVIGGFQGLIVGAAAGQAIALLVVRLRISELRTPIPDGAPTLWTMARRYKKMPLLNGPNALLDAISAAGINTLIGRIAVGDLGQYSMAQRSTSAPAGMINGAIVQVFLQKMSTTPRGRMAPLLWAIIKRIVLVSAPVFLAFYLLAPTVVPFVFGNQWVEAGLLAQALIPWVMMGTFTAPMANVFIVTERQGTLLLFSIGYNLAPLVFLSLSPFQLLDTIRLLSLIMAALQLVSLGLAMLVARRYDRQ